MNRYKILVEEVTSGLLKVQSAKSGNGKSLTKTQKMKTRTQLSQQGDENHETYKSYADVA
ncbi:hypothetical protein FRX31_031095 [Thalictrum thalictroides]|uniref:Uncharacterized protein n=1 Tax=Thalictrum thalictroides TaxID=46969 RepID=A0A7J6V3R4_THATH|nr:hypothetical protein FRX31_031095 [Thalictrum thalictroides]